MPVKSKNDQTQPGWFGQTTSRQSRSKALFGSQSPRLSVNDGLSFPVPNPPPAPCLPAPQSRYTILATTVNIRQTRQRSSSGAWAREFGCCDFAILGKDEEVMEGLCSPSLVRDVPADRSLGQFGEEWNRLRAEVSCLRGENQELRRENQELRQQLGQLQTEVTGLQRANLELRQEAGYWQSRHRAAVGRI